MVRLARTEADPVGMVIQGHVLTRTGVTVPVPQYRCFNCANVYNGAPRPFCGEAVPPVIPPAAPVVVTDPLTGLVTTILNPIVGLLTGGWP